MQSVNTEVHLQLKVTVGPGQLNALLGAGRQLGAAAARAVVAQALWDVQEAAWRRVRAGRAAVPCPGCGDRRRGRGALLRRGRRHRLLQTSSGRLRFALRQVSCTACGATFCPFGPVLGLRPRQRVADELLEQLSRGVLDLSYQKTCTLARAWLGGAVGPRTLWRAVQARGAQVAWPAVAPGGVLLVDGTRVRAGTRPLGEAAVLGLEVQGRAPGAGRPRAATRLVGFAVGRRAWDTVLPAAQHAAVVVTDAAAGVRERVQVACPQARHQLCEWHLPHTLQHFLGMQGVPTVARQALGRELSAILRQAPAVAWPAYRAFGRRLRRYRKATSLLRQAMPYILHPDRTSERTTSLAERVMREINRRTDIGVRWSIAGVENLLRLRLAARYTPEAYARLWPAAHPVPWQLVPQTP